MHGLMKPTPAKSLHIVCYGPPVVLLFRLNFDQFLVDVGMLPLIEEWKRGFPMTSFMYQSDVK